MVGQRTMGRSLSTGRGASLAALAARASRRDFFLPGYIEAGEQVRADRLDLAFVDAGATAPKNGLRGELPGRSARAHGVASPCGSGCAGSAGCA